MTIPTLVKTTTQGQHPADRPQPVTAQDGESCRAGDGVGSDGPGQILDLITICAGDGHRNSCMNWDVALVELLKLPVQRVKLGLLTLLASPGGLDGCFGSSEGEVEGPVVRFRVA